MGHDHLLFKTHWQVTEKTKTLLGECVSLIYVLKGAPLTPSARARLMSVAFKRGVLATTAIEGNSVTDEEYDDIIQNNKKLPPSREYQEQEVKNVLEAFIYIKDQVLDQGMDQIITPDVIKDFHRRIIKDLGAEAQAVPGRFRDNNVVVGGYRPPDYADISKLMNEYCTWLQSFGYTQNQSLEAAIIEAVIAHIYLEWIHPFGDGNGRTGRLIEFYILVRAGLPMIASHILSNFYNNTRDKYYKMFDICRKEKELTKFIDYAILGFRDGLRKTYESVQESQIAVFWQRVIFDAFEEIQHTKKEAHKRKRRMMLNFPLNRGISLKNIPLETNTFEYRNMTEHSLRKDVKEMVELDLLRQDGHLYYANWEQVCMNYFDLAKKGKRKAAK